MQQQRELCMALTRRSDVMDSKKDDKSPQEKDVSKEQTAEITIDLRDLYSYDPKTTLLNITDTRYSNLAYIQVSQRDVYIDFLEMPGQKRNGDFFVDGTRIFLSHVAAQKLAKALGELLEKVHSEGAIEKLISKEDSKKTE
jgi:hypothetical protein